MRLGVIVCAVAAGLVALSSPSHAGFTRTWAASSGQYPTADCFWDLITSDVSQATLAAGSLEIKTVALGSGHYYYQAGPQLSIPDPWVIEARVRIDSDTGNGTAATSAAIGFATTADYENILFIGAGTMYIWSSYFVIGSQAFLDTQSAFHTYRVEVTGAGAVSVFYDGTLTLTGSLDSNPGYEDSSYLWWGDGTSHASGTSQWESVTHNGAAYEDCPTPAPTSTWGKIKNAYRR